MLTKDEFMQAYENIKQLEDLFAKAETLFNQIPEEIQDAIYDFNDKGIITRYYGLKECIRFGHIMVYGIMSNWHVVVSELDTSESGT